MIGILYCGKELGYISWLLPPPPPLYCCCGYCIAELVNKMAILEVTNVAFALSSFTIHIWLQWPCLRSEL